MGVFLETERLLLKTSDPTELQHWILLCQDPAVMKYIGSVKTKEEIEDLFFNMAAPYHKKYGLGFCSVFEKETGYFIGQAGLFHIGYDDTKTDIEVAYRFQEKFWGKGYATEVTKALIEWGFTNLTVQKLIGFAREGNIASKQVLMKVGMHYTGNKVKHENQEVLCYEINRSTFIKIKELNCH